MKHAIKQFAARRKYLSGYLHPNEKGSSSSSHMHSPHNPHGDMNDLSSKINYLKGSSLP